MSDNNTDFIKITDIENTKTIKKPWGHEKWIADGAPDFKYALKEIMIRTSFQSSIQFHEYKHETTYVKSGKGYLYYNENPIDIKKFNAQEYSDEEIQDFVQNMKKIEIASGKIYHIKPGIIHRVEAVTDLTFIESSTIELDDVIRINDQWGRTAGKIETEHVNMKKFRDFYKEQKHRLDFIKPLSKGIVLNNNYLLNTEYSFAKELLDNGCKQVWHKNTDVPNKVNLRYVDENHLLKFKKFDTYKFDDKSFDTIIAFETIQYDENPEEKINEYYKLLNNSGVLIISTLNKNKLDVNSSSPDTSNEFSKNSFMELLKKNFSTVDLFSQRNTLDKDTMKDLPLVENPMSKLKNVAKNVLLKLDPNSNFYKLHLQKTVLNIREKQQKNYFNLQNPTFVPIPYENAHSPLYFIAVCRKK
ncbi:MAG: methyltransferase domain-containing protein [Candidatus Nitrosopelagicus sp.]|nr:methyltransferase domain-containing protein [Candidatus Nitrosopelagicus sp.]